MTVISNQKVVLSSSCAYAACDALWGIVMGYKGQKKRNKSVHVTGESLHQNCIYCNVSLFITSHMK